MRKNRGQTPIQYVTVILVIVALAGSWMAYSSAGPANTEGLATKRNVSSLEDKISDLRNRINSLEEGQSSIMDEIGVTAPPRLHVTSISAPSVKVGEEATIEVSVTNTGGKSGSKNIAPNVAGEALEPQSVTVSAGETETITFTVTREESGDYTISADGETSTLSISAVERFYGIATKIVHNVWEGLFQNTFRWYCEDHGLKYNTLQARGNPTLQNQQIRRLVDMGADGIIVAAQDADVSASAVEYAANHDVPVFTTDADVNSEHVTMYVGYSGVRASRMLGEETVDYLTDKYGEPKGKVLEIRGPMGGASAEDRHNGFIEVMNEHDDITVETVCGDFKRETAIDKATPKVQAKDFDALYAGNGPMVMGGVVAIESVDKNPKDMYICTIDAIPSVIDAIKAGKVACAFDQPCPFYNPVALHYMDRYIEEGPEALPEEGTTVTVDDLTIKSAEHVGTTWWKTQMWAPAEITTREGHLWFQTAGILVNENNCDLKSLWANAELPGW